MTRDEICEAFLAQVPYDLYPMQEEALLAWFSSDQGVLVSAPTGMGKTLIAEAVAYEALATGRRMYYTTPLIALTDQKFHEMQVKAAQWGFDPNDVGLVTGNRRINPNAKVLVVVAEILFNRLLHHDTEEDVERGFLNFDDVDAVVMDEFHQFNDPERGIVWEFSLGLLPVRVRTLLLSATVGNAKQFAIWLETRHRRKLEVVESDERKVPLTFIWDEEDFLEDFVESMALGDDETRKTPALIFCFSRDQCWDVAEILKGKRLIAAEQQSQLVALLNDEDMSLGVGPKLKQLLLRGVGVHHAGVLPKYRRIVEKCFQRKLLAVCACTETLSAGINLPARSIVLPSLIKGPKGKKRLIPFGTAHQIFGRAGRPQFDTQGYVFALAHPDDVKILRWQKKYDQIPDNTPDPNLQKAKKQLKKKQPKRSPEEQYWTEKQFEILRDAKAENLHSVGQIPWRLLAYMLTASPDVQALRKLVKDRLLDFGRMERGQKDLDDMLLTLCRSGYITLEPQPPAALVSEVDPLPGIRPEDVNYPVVEPAYPFLTQRSDDAAQGPDWAADLQESEDSSTDSKTDSGTDEKADEKADDGFGFGLFDEEEEAELSAEKAGETDEKDSAVPAEGIESADKKAAVLAEGIESAGKKAAIPAEGIESDGKKAAIPAEGVESADKKAPVLTLGMTTRDKAELLAKQPQLKGQIEIPVEENYEPIRANATEKLSLLTQIRSVNPLYGVFLLEQLAEADTKERVQAFESVLELPTTLLRNVRVPKQYELPPGRLAQGRLDKQLLQLGLATIDELVEKTFEEIQAMRDQFGGFPNAEERVWVIPFAEKLYRLFQYQYPKVQDVSITPVWAAGELLEFNGDFNKYITSKGLQRQEGLIFRHLLRLILLLEEFAQLTPPGISPFDWQDELQGIANYFKDCCRRVDPMGTDEILAREEQERAEE